METTSVGKWMASGRDKFFLLVLAMAVFFVGAVEFMLSAMLGPLAEAFRTSAAGASWLISGYAFSYALAAPVFGYLSDRVDRVRLLLFALPAFAIDGMGVALAPNLQVAMALRVFGGIASAVLIPTAFALVSEIVPRERQAGAMGLVMLGMTLGIALGPALAGLLTAWSDWRTPFLATAGGCMVAFLIGSRTAPRRRSDRAATGVSRRPFQWLGNWSVLRPLIAKGAWNGTGVAAFLLSGEILGRRHDLGVAEVGITVTAFGIGLGIGNLSAGRLRRVCGREEISLVATTSLLVAAVTTFVLVPLPLAESFGCLIAWGGALGAGAPSGTTILAERAGGDKGMVLAFAETFNNVFIFGLLPAASALFDQGNDAGVMAVLGVGLSVGAGLTILDASLSDRRKD